MATSETQLEQTLTGVITWYGERGYGYVEGPTGKHFIHANGQRDMDSLRAAMPYHAPKAGDIVTFRSAPAKPGGIHPQAWPWSIKKAAAPQPAKHDLPMAPPPPLPEPIELVIFRVAAGEEWIFEPLLRLVRSGKILGSTMRVFCKVVGKTGIELVKDLTHWEINNGLTMTKDGNWELYVLKTIGENVDKLTSKSAKPGCCGRCHPPT